MLYRYYAAVLFLPLVIFFQDATIAQTQGNQPTTEDSTSYLVILSNLENFHLVIDDRFQDALEVHAGDTIAVTPGTHRFRVVNRRIYDEEFILNMPGNTIVEKQVVFQQFYEKVDQSSAKRIKLGGNIEVSTDNKTRIYIDGQYSGRGYAVIDTTLDTYKITLKHPEHGTITQKVELAFPFEVKTVERYHIKQVDLSLFDHAVPALGHIKQGRFKRGLGFTALLAAAATSALIINSSYNDVNSNLQATIAEYNQTTDTETAIRLRRQADRQFANAKDKQQLRNRLLFATAGVYAISILDTFLKPRNGYPSPSGRVTGGIAAQPNLTESGVNPGLTLNLKISL